MVELALAAAFLLLTHFGISSTRVRGTLIARLGENAYRGVYSLIALGALVWLIWAYADAPYVALWPASHVGAWIVLIVMPAALLLLVCGVSGPNPTAVGAPGGTDANKRARGILRVTRHPVMWGIALFALAHLAPNGDLASLILFGALALLALVGTVLIDAKYERREGEAYRRFEAVTSNVPFAAIAAGRQHLALSEIGWTRPLIALALYALLVALHPWLFGVSALAVV